MNTESQPTVDLNKLLAAELNRLEESQTMK